MSGYVALPTPVTADPNFYRQGLEGLNALRDTQAKQASADAYRQSMNPDGTVNTPQYNALIASGPGAWNAGPLMEQQGRAAGAQANAGTAQLSYAAAGMKLMGESAMTVAKDPSDVNVNASFDNLKAHGYPADKVESERARWLAMSLAERQNNALRIGLQSLDQLHQVIGQTTGVDTGGQFQPVTITQPGVRTPGSLTVGPGAANVTLSPGEASRIVDVQMGDGTTQQMPLSDAVTQLSKNPAMRILGPTTGGGGSGGDSIAGLPKDQALAAIVQRESGGKNIPTAILGADGKPASTASGFYQMLDSTWQEGAALAGIKNPPPRAMNASKADQDAAASALYDKYGTQPWAKSGTPTSSPTPAASTAPPAAQAGAPQSTATVGRPGGPGTYLGPGMGVLPAAPAPVARTSPTLRSDIQGGVQVASANPLQVPTAGAPGPPSPLVQGDVNAIMQGRANARATPASGVQTAFNALQSGGGSMVAPPPAPAAPAPPPAATPPPGPTIGRSAPLGTTERVTADIGAYTKDSAANGIHQNNINTLQNAYMALQLADTGPGTQNLQAARAFLQSFGIATAATGDQATQWAEAHKYLMDFARTQGGLGGTDLQAQLAQGSNASTDIPKPAALAVVRNNIARERMSMAQVLEAAGPTGYVDHTKTFLPSQDLRAYQADIMPPQELKQIEALQKTNPKAFEKFQKSLDIARAHGLISDEDLAAQNQRIRALGP